MEGFYNMIVRIFTILIVLFISMISFANIDSDHLLVEFDLREVENYHFKENSSTILSEKYDMPDGVKSYVDRLKKCYQTKNALNDFSNNNTENNMLRCKDLFSDSQKIHYIYYNNMRIINYINIYEKSYPFF